MAGMELLPSGLLIAKKVDRVDTRLAQLLDQPMVTNPLDSEVPGCPPIWNIQPKPTKQAICIHPH